MKHIPHYWDRLRHTGFHKRVLILLAAIAVCAVVLFFLKEPMAMGKIVELVSEAFGESLAESLVEA